MQIGGRKSGFCPCRLPWQTYTIMPAPPNHDPTSGIDGGTGLLRTARKVVKELASGAWSILDEGR